MPRDSFQLPEFDAQQVEDAIAAFDRRTFLKLMGATLAATGLSQLAACSKPQPPEKIVPYVRSPEHTIPGLPAFYASALPTRNFASGFARGVIIESHEGRPTKIEGNPLHPSSLGATDIFMQAAILQLYDPDRSKSPLTNNQETTWEKVVSNLSKFISIHGGQQNIRIGILTSTLTSPTVLAQLTQLRSRFPNLRFFLDDPLTPTSARLGQQQAFARPVTALYDFTQAKRILSLDAHFLAEEPGSLRYARDFARSRRLPTTAATMSRLYMAECDSTYTGAIADHRIGVTPSMIPLITAHLLRAISSNNTAPRSSLPTPVAEWIAIAAKDLLAHRNQSLILAGPYQPPEVHAGVFALNALLNNVGATIDYLDPIEFLPPSASTLADLTHALNASEIDLLLMLDINPAYTAPADLNFPEALKNFSAHSEHLTIHHSAYADETAVLCTHHLPLSHPLESWSDGRGHDGTASIIQPLIEPLWQSRSVTELLALVLAENPSAAPTGYDLLRAHWLVQWSTLSPTDRERQWRKSLRDGIIPNTAAAPLTHLPAPDTDAILTALATIKPPPENTIELSFRPDPTIADGFYANHPWLQELPKPLTTITWDTVALIAPATAAKLGITRPEDPARENFPTLKFVHNNAVAELPVWIQPNHPENTITLPLGGGRQNPYACIDSIQSQVGVNVNSLRTTASPWHAQDIKVEVTTNRVPIACTQPTQFMSGHDLAIDLPINSLQSPPPPVQKKSLPLSLYEPQKYPGYKWGMLIDLSACIGCSACVIACQAENNIPSVGKEQVLRRREMHWLRIDTYYGPASAQSLSDVAPASQIHFQPMMCQHCENAPCEVVCPVEATTHSDEGINEMTYNRCVGTRYCSNNCPYKVRRFNFFDYNYADTETTTLESMQKNPNVTVRSRGVMEKCTYCIQRINRARITAKRNWTKNSTNPPDLRTPSKGVEDLPRLQIQTACQQSCPTQAITFGDLNDPASAVAQQKKSPLSYAVLEEQNTQPRTTYLPRLINKDPALPEQGGAA